MVGAFLVSLSANVLWSSLGFFDGRPSFNWVYRVRFLCHLSLILLRSNAMCGMVMVLCIGFLLRFRRLDWFKLGLGRFHLVVLYR